VTTTGTATTAATARGWRVGDLANVVHNCAGHPARPHPAVFRVERVTRLTAGSARLSMTRCDGSALDVVVDAAGVPLTTVLTRVTT
jgi:hypothetical protein